ncbi:hypothetical protein [Plantactinospora alkalitolerans]|uniref:hypothetical protein n=1 Tax=Plantactinospora alkalitolerans TaxID=2789879 RepID=UPI001E439E8B|nr:hypothetical protein [Plantactinospora alkalitolerans]
MHVFPARIPAAEARRADVVDVRVARKVAPLFGLGGDVPPYHRSWVCDYTALSLAEIGRGAPSPDRAERSRLEADPPRHSVDGEQPGWAWSGRSVWSAQHGSLPGALSNATLNRYGPDTKAAAVLAAANRLLGDATDAVAAACRHLAGVDSDAEVRLAVWAGLVLEVYRAQPALVIAAVQARQVQRSLSARWGAQVDRARVTGVDAPSEIHPRTSVTDGDADPDGSGARWRPTSFDLIDSTLPALGLADHPAAGPGLVTADALDDMASAWCQRLLGVGRPGRGLVWLTEDVEGSRRVHAMVRVGAVVAPFVAASLGGTSVGDRASPPVLPVLPAGDALAAAPLLQRRAHLLMAHVTANYVRYRDELLRDWPQLRTQTKELVAAAVHRCAEILDADDPVSLQLRAYAAYLDVWDASRGRGHTADAGAASGSGDAGRVAAVRRLTASQQRVMGTWRSGRLDPGAAAYLLEIGVVALRDAVAGPLSSADLADTSASTYRAGEGPAPATVRAWWSAILEARGLDPGADLATLVDSLSDAQVFHLQHYAAWLADGGRRADLRRALVIQERVAAIRAEVTRGEPAGFAAKSEAARAGYELAAEIATDLALATPEREHGARVRALERAVRHVHAVLADPTTRGLLRSTGPQAALPRTARVVARALCVAASHGVIVEAEDAVVAAALLDAVIGAEGPGDIRPRTPADEPDGTQQGGSDNEPGRCRTDATPRGGLRDWRTHLADIAAAPPSELGNPAGTTQSLPATNGETQR